MNPYRFAKETDPHWDKVSALLHMDGEPNSTTFKDETGKIWTPSGTAKISNTNSVFGQSAEFQGGDSRVDATLSDDFMFGTGDFTIECWFCRRVQTGNENFLSFDTSCSLYVASDGRLYFYDGWFSTSFNVLSGEIISNNKWYHHALTRKDGVLMMFSEGELRGSRSYNKNWTSRNFFIGSGPTRVSRWTG